MIANGKLICIEGADGSGKTTLCRELADEITKLTDKPCVTIAFPSRASAPGALIRDVFEGKQKVIPEAMLWLFIAEGVDMEPQINAWLNEGRTVIVDRHTAFSQLIYQTELHTKAEVEQASAPAKFRKPDMVYVLDIAPEVAITRREARGEARNKLYEPEDIAKLKAMRVKYLEVAWDSGATIINSGVLSTKEMVDTIMDDLKHLKDPV
jgi:dTMP kinase